MKYSGFAVNWESEDRIVRCDCSFTQYDCVPDCGFHGGTASTLRFLILVTALPPCKRTLSFLGKHGKYLGDKGSRCVGGGEWSGGD